MRHLLLLSVLLLGVSWAAAQNNPSQTTPTGAGSETTVQGCLGGSDGNYTLTDKNGTSFQLTGDTASVGRAGLTSLGDVFNGSELDRLL